MTHLPCETLAWCTLPCVVRWRVMESGGGLCSGVECAGVVRELGWVVGSMCYDVCSCDVWARGIFCDCWLVGCEVRCEVWSVIFEVCGFWGRS